MSYDFSICNAPLPEDFDAAEREVERLAEEPEPNQAVFHELIDRLTARYPCICDCEDGVWCAGPLREASYHRAYGMGLCRMVDEVMPFVVETATALGLTVIDRQTGKIHRPTRRPTKKLRQILDFVHGLHFVVGGVGCLVLGCLFAFDPGMRTDSKHFTLAHLPPAIGAFLVGVLLCFLGFVVLRRKWAGSERELPPSPPTDPYLPN